MTHDCDICGEEARCEDLLVLGQAYVHEECRDAAQEAADHAIGHTR